MASVSVTVESETATVEMVCAVVPCFTVNALAAGFAEARVSRVSEKVIVRVVPATVALDTVGAVVSRVPDPSTLWFVSAVIAEWSRFALTLPDVDWIVPLFRSSALAATAIPSESVSPLATV